MAIVFLNQSKCSICDTIMYEHEEIILFPAFTSNQKDPLYPFSDESLHYSCLGKHLLHQKALAFRETILSKTRPENRICDIGGNRIDQPENYLFIGLLTSDELNPLYAFNFMNIDIQNIPKWSKKEGFLSLLEQFSVEDQLQSSSSFDYLDYLMKKIQSF